MASRKKTPPKKTIPKAPPKKQTAPRKAVAKKAPFPIKLTYVTIAIFLILVALGSWQIYRLNWKNAIIEQATEQQSLPPVMMAGGSRITTLPDGKSKKTPHIIYHACCEKLCESFCTKTENGKLYNYRNMMAAGWFEHDHEIFIGAKYINGEFGYYVITPFTIAYGPTILVVRGFVPEAKRNIDNRPESALVTIDDGRTGTLLEGVIRDSEKPPAWYLPQARPDKREWYSYDLPSMVKFLKDKDGLDVLPILVQQTAPKPLSEYPKLLESSFTFRNDHLSYAFTWYSLAVVLLVIYGIYVRKSTRKP